VDRDYLTERREYERAGVLEYWIVDPRKDSRDPLFLVLENGAYAERFAKDGVYHSTAVPDLWLKVDWLWEDEPDVVARVLEVLGRR
jgi:Uma2 family endonuclease